MPFEEVLYACQEVVNMRSNFVECWRVSDHSGVPSYLERSSHASLVYSNVFAVAVFPG